MSTKPLHEQPDAVARANRVTNTTIRQARKDGHADLCRDAHCGDYKKVIAARIAIADLYGVA